MRKFRHPLLRDGLVGAWCPSLGYTGGLLLDRSGRNNHGLLTSMDPGTDWIASNGKLALDFDGSDDYIDIGTKRIIEDENYWSVSAWLYIRSGGGYPCYFLILGPSGTTCGLSGNSVSVTANVNGYGSAPTVNFTSNRWDHYCVTKLGSTVTLFQNGISVSGGGAPEGDYFVTVNSLALGYFANRANALVDDAGVFNRALTQAEVSLLAQRRGIAHETYRVPVVRGASVGGGVTATPTTLALTLSTFAPVVSTPILATPTTAALTITAFAPTVSTPVVATPSTATLSLTTFAPVIATPVVATPTTTAITLTAFAPAVTAGGSASVTPTTASLTLTSFAPTVTAGGSATVTPTTASLAITSFAPTISTPQTVTPTTASLTLTGFAPTVGQPVSVTPGTAALTLTTYAANIVNPVTVTPTTRALVLTTYAPNLGDSQGSAYLYYLLLN